MKTLINSQSKFLPKKKKFKIFQKNQISSKAWELKTFDEDRFIKISMNGLFVQVGNFSNFKTVDELYPEIRNVIDSKGLIVAKRKYRTGNLLSVKSENKRIPF
ncbi:hypothetical protein HYH68_16425 [Clostridium botulinum]|nr:hypothetical protein [Clostridium botulinum]